MQALPKIELHLHLDCSLSYDAVVAIDPAFTPQRFAEAIVAPPKCRDLSDYLARTRASVALLQTEYALHIAVEDLVRQLKGDGVIYAEIRFAPLLHLERGLTPEQVVHIVTDATDAACAHSDVDVRLILCTLRHFTAEQSMLTAQLVDQFRGSRVVALDLAGDEAGFPLDAHIPTFEYAMARGIPRTAHAGEAQGPPSVWDVLDQLQPQRIGHGVRSLDDPKLVEYLAATGVHLEVCPTCNVQIDLFPTHADHPIDALYRAGVSVGVNTDTRTVTPVTLTDEYDRLLVSFGWRAGDFLAVNLNALHASFAPDNLKASLEARLREGYAPYVEGTNA